jgi:hypothetical protein
MKLALLLLVFLACGCSTAPSMIDVTADARFQSGYRAGQVYQLIADGYLTRTSSAAQWELWTAQDVVREPRVEVTKVPAGATVRIARLAYLFNPEHPPTPGGTPEAVLAYGSLTFPDGHVWPGEVAILPALHDPTEVAGTTLLVYPVDGEFLREVK